MITTLAFKPKLLTTLRHYNKQQFTTDLLAGIIVGIVALPLAIAFGIASGVTPEKGIITAIVAGLIVSLLGGSKVQIGGPTGAFIIIIYGIIQQYGFEGLTIATLMAGVFLIMFGVLHLGTIIKYIPYPIVVGFTSGIALTIFTTQIKDLFGLTMETVPSDFIEKWVAYIGSFGTIDLWSAGVGIGSVAVIAAWPMIAKYNNVLKKLPGSLIANWCRQLSLSPFLVLLNLCFRPRWLMVLLAIAMIQTQNLLLRVWPTWQAQSSAVFLLQEPSHVQ